MIKGFLFAIGFVFGIAAIIWLAIVLRKLSKKPVHAKVKTWKKYLNMVIEASDYKEAAFVNELILGKRDEEEIKTPAGYSVAVTPELIIDEENDKSKVKLKKIYTIIKKCDAKSK